MNLSTDLLGKAVLVILLSIFHHEEAVILVLVVKGVA